MNNAETSEKIAAVVILYYPDEALIGNIRSYYDYVDKIYVFDNSEYQKAGIDWSAFSKIEYHHDGANKGLAERKNAAAAKAIKEGYDWLLTMDQDSSFSEQAMAGYYHCFLNFKQKKDTAVIGPVHSEKEPVQLPGCSWQEVERLITSGALINLSCFERIGGFDEALFIDSVDCDYCIRAKLSGFKVVRFTSTFMLHQLGSKVCRSSIKTLFLVKKTKTIHSPLRYYYRVRNLLYLKRKYRAQRPAQLREIEAGIQSGLITYLLYGRNYRELFQFLLLAYRHYKTGKMGRLVLPKQKAAAPTEKALDPSI